MYIRVEKLTKALWSVVPIAAFLGHNVIDDRFLDSNCSVFNSTNVVAKAGYVSYACAVPTNSLEAVREAPRITARNHFLVSSCIHDLSYTSINPARRGGAEINQDVDTRT